MPQIEPVGATLHRVRLLRSGVPEPRAHHDSAPADRDPPRDGAPAGGLAAADGAARAVRYDAVETCAGDGTCRIACPVQIDTGKLMKSFRAREHGRGAERVALRAADRWSAVERAARGGLRAGHGVAALAGDGPCGPSPSALRGVVGTEAVPAWTEGMPPPAPSLPPTAACRRRGRLLPRLHQPHLRPPQRSPVARWSRFRRAPACRCGSRRDVAGHCCATPWSSKGFREGAALMANRTVERLWEWSERASCRSSSMPRRARSGSRRRWCRASPTKPRRHARCGSWTRSPGRTTSCCPGCGSHGASARRRSTRPARRGTSA